MKNFIKKSLSLFLAFAIIFGSALVGLNEIDFAGIEIYNPFAVKTKAASVDDLTFEISSDFQSYYVDRCNTSASGELVIPSTYNGSPVTHIDYYAFENCTNLTSIVISEGITSIWYGAFQGCTGLKSVVIPGSVTDIGYCAFKECTSLESVTIGNGVTSVGDSAFYNCTALTSIELPDTVEYIGNSAFYGCTSLDSIVIPDSVTSIGEYAFFCCDSLQDVYVSGLSAWCNIDFYDSSSNPLFYAENLYVNNELGTDLVIPEGVTSIKPYVFYDCDSLKSIVIPDSVTDIAGRAFYGCDSLESVAIGNSVTSIGDFAFRNCTNLESVTIGNSVTSIGEAAFFECYSLQDVYISDLSAWCNIDFFDYLSTPLLYAENLYVNNELGTDLVIPEGVTSIKPYVFYDCGSLKSIVIPDSVTNIGDFAFRNCINLESVAIGNSVTSIGDFAFDSCCVAVITIPQSVTSIGDNAFSCHYEHSEDELGGCYVSNRPFFCYKDSYAHNWLTQKGYQCALIDGSTDEVTEGGTVGAYTWSLNKLTGVLELSGSGKMADFTTMAAPWCDWEGFVTEVKLPDGLTNISANAFSGLYRLNKIDIPDSVTAIGGVAFSYCYGLKSIVIPDSVTSIGVASFQNCISLRSVVTGNGVTSIGAEAFYNCVSLESLVIPDSVTRIEDETFFNCTSLKSIDFPDGVTSIGEMAFYDCISLKSIELSDGITSIGYKAFYCCKSLESIVIPDSVRRIDGDAFAGCYRIENIEFALDERYNCSLTDMPNIAGTNVKSVFVPSSISYASYNVFPSDIESVTICNPEFVFNSSCGLNYNSTIIGFKGSTAETFASDIGATFVDIETVHAHSYKSFEEKGYCSFARCTCGKEEKVAHTDSDINGICDSCSKNLNDINLNTPIKVLVEDGSYNYCVFIAPQAGRYTLTVDKECYMLSLYDAYENRITYSYSTKQLSYNLQAGEKVTWSVLYSNDSTANLELELTLTYVPNHEHSYTSKITTPATCTTNGVRTYTCTCGDSYTETIWSYGHTYGSWYVATAGSCSEGTVIKRDCINCGLSEKMTFAASGKHTEVTTISRATDTHDGCVTTACSVCGHKISEKTIAKIASVKLSATKYTYNGKTKTPSVTVKDSAGKILEKDTDYTVTYSSGRKNAGVYTVTVKFKGNYGGTEKINFTIVPKTPANFTYSATSTTAVKLSWQASTGATGYIVYKYNTSTKKYEKIAVVDGKTSYTVSSLKAGSSYSFKIRAYKELNDDNVIYGAYTSVITAYTKPATPTLKVSSGSKGVANLSWTNVAGESGYQVYYSTSKSSGYKKLGSYKANVVKGSKKKLTSGKTYYFKVRAYTKTSSGTIYGSWSTVKSVKIK